jgi:DNA-binding beta-propeller fold protein YncE
VEIFPNGGRKSGGETIQIYGYGFGNDAGQVSVKIGGQRATIQKVENIAAIAASLGLPADYPFPVERITVVTPAGTVGKADVAITSAAGTVTAAKGFQFLETVTLFTKPGLYKFVQYDPKRQWIYMGTTDHVDVFDLSGQTFRSGLQPPGGPPPDAAIRGLSLTPDGSQLVIADFGAQSVYLLNPDSGAGTTVAVGGVPGFLNSNSCERKHFARGDRRWEWRPGRLASVTESAPDPSGDIEQFTALNPSTGLILPPQMPC